MTLKNYSNQKLSGTDFSGVDLTEADMSNSDLSGADFSIARLQDANLTFADMTGVNLGETQAFNCVAISPDGRILASAGRDKFIRIWDASSGYELRILKGHTDDINHIIFSPDGRLLASASDDKTIRLWDVESGHEVRSFQGHTGSVLCVAFSSDGSLLASGGGGGGDKGDFSLRLWEINTRQELALLQGHTEWVSTVAFSPDGQLLASGGGENSVKLWHIADRTVIRTISGFPDDIKSVAFDGTGKLLFVLSNDLAVIEGGSTAFIFPGHTDTVRSIAFSPDARFLASGSDDSSIRIWHVESGREVRILRGHTGYVLSIVFSPDGRLLASGSSDQSIRIWNVENGSEVRVLQKYTEYVNSVAFSPDGRLLASGSDDKSIRIWNLENGSEVRVLQGHTSYIQSVIFSPDGQFLASGSDDKSIRIWQVESGREVQALQGHTGAVHGVSFSPDGQILASASSDKSVRIWRVESGREVRVLQGHTDYVQSVAFSPDGQLLASGSDDKAIRIWQVESGREARVLQGHSDYVYGVAFSPKGQQLASASSDKSIRIWDAETGREIRAMTGRSEPNAAAFLDEKNIAIADENGVIEIWQMENFQKQISAKVHTDWINSLSFSAYANLVVSASDDQSLGLLDITSGHHRLIRQELHCLRTNIFGVHGLRDEQKDLMLRKGGIEIDPKELPQNWQTKNLREVLRTRRLRKLASELTRDRKKEKYRLPVILIVGPGTFLPAAGDENQEDFYDPKGFLPISSGQIRRDFPTAQRVFEHLYEGLIMDPIMNPKYYWYRNKSFPNRGEKSRCRQEEQILNFRENYNALIQLVNKQIFNAVLDFDVFSQLHRGMFSSSLSEGKFSEFEDIEYSLHRLKKDLRYVEKGQTLFFKFFTEEFFSREKSTSSRYQFGKLFDQLFYAFGDEATIVWTGFFIREFGHNFERFTEREKSEGFCWVIDESIHETNRNQISATYIDYPFGRFSDVFRDLHTELALSERAVYAEIQEDDITRLYQLAHSDKEEERISVARELVSRLAAKPKTETSQLQLSLNALRRDIVPAVRQSVLRAIMENHARIPRELSGLIPGFARDPDDTLRADVARWILTQYSESGENYDSLLKELAQDKSQFVRQVIVDTITQRFERLPAHIRLLASQLVGAPIEVQMIKGSGMLTGETNELILRITNRNESVLESVEIELIQPSAEYQVIGSNPVKASSLQPEQHTEIRFEIKVMVQKQIAINYRVNGELKEPPLYINAIQDNPYFYGDAVKEDYQFFGRKEELEQIIQAVTKPTKQDILIVGERRTGKTSLIYQLIKRLEKPYIPLYVKLDEAEKRTESLLSLIRYKMIGCLIEHGLLSNDWRSHNFIYANFEDNIKEILDAVKINLSDAKIVLLIDEADYLLKIELMQTGLRGMIDLIMRRKEMDERVQNILRSALQSMKIGADLRAVVAGTSILSTYITQGTSPFFNHFRFVPLEPFLPETIRELITKPASVLGYSYSQDAIERIVALSGGQPFYCQAICYEAFGNALKSSRYLVGVEDVRIAEEKRIKDMFGAYTAYFWNRTDKTEKRFLSVLARGSSVTEFSPTQIKRLLDWGIITEKNNNYAFAGGLVEAWTKMALGGR